MCALFYIIVLALVWIFRNIKSCWIYLLRHFLFQKSYDEWANLFNSIYKYIYPALLEPQSK